MSFHATSSAQEPIVGGAPGYCGVGDASAERMKEKSRLKTVEANISTIAMN